MSCFQTLSDYGLRSLGYGERLLPKADITLCEQFVLIGSGMIWNIYFAFFALLFGFFFAVDTRFQNILLPAWFISGFLMLIALGLISYVWKKDYLDKAVLGGLALGISIIAFMVVFSVWDTGTSSQIKIPVVFIQSLPYVLTVVVLAGFVGKAIPPRAGGQPYVKER